MRFVAGRGAAAKSHREDVGGRALRLSGWLAGAPWRKQLAGAPWRSCWQGRCSEEPSGRCWWPGAAAERLVGRGAVAKKLATPWQRAIGKKLLTRGAAVAKMLLTGGAGWQVPYSAEVPRTEGFPAEVQLLKPPASSITL